MLMHYVDYATLAHIQLGVLNCQHFESNTHHQLKCNILLIHLNLGTYPKFWQCK
jgi:hypothetical protein